jgi:hypothetical protein
MGQIRCRAVNANLHDVAVTDRVLPPDALTVEPRRRAPHPSAAERGPKVVVDPVGDIGDGRPRVERQWLAIDSAILAELDTDEARQRPRGGPE